MTTELSCVTHVTLSPRRAPTLARFTARTAASAGSLATVEGGRAFADGGAHVEPSADARTEPESIR